MRESPAYLRATSGWTFWLSFALLTGAMWALFGWIGIGLWWLLCGLAALVASIQSNQEANRREGPLR